jgi:molecular chaperone DnaK (HSP70)
MLSLLFLSLLFNLSKANVIGFDLGSSFFKITLVKPGQPFSIVENISTQRKSHNMLTITDELRLFGPDSFMEMTKYPTSTFEGIQKWLGKEYNEEEISQ